MKFAMFFMGEYANMLIVSSIAILLFFGGWLAPFGFMSQIPADAVYSAPAWSRQIINPAWLINTINMAILAPFWFGIKLFTLICFFILLRASLPRLRYDMLMKFGWKGMLPTALMNIVLIALSLALQQQLGLAGHLLAVLAGVALCLVLLAGKYAGYRKQRRGTADDDTVPIRRPSVLASSAGAGAPTGTAAAALPPPVAPAAAPAAAPGKAS
jgi:NADH-quinone oxidoreductase subunit H